MPKAGDSRTGPGGEKQFLNKTSSGQLFWSGNSGANQQMTNYTQPNQVQFGTKKEPRTYGTPYQPTLGDIAKGTGMSVQQAAGLSTGTVEQVMSPGIDARNVISISTNKVIQSYDIISLCQKIIC